MSVRTKALRRSPREAEGAKGEEAHEDYGEEEEYLVPTHGSSQADLGYLRWIHSLKPDCFNLFQGFNNLFVDCLLFSMLRFEGGCILATNV